MGKIIGIDLAHHQLLKVSVVEKPSIELSTA